MDPQGSPACLFRARYISHGQDVEPNVFTLLTQQGLGRTPSSCGPSSTLTVLRTAQRCRGKRARGTRQLCPKRSEFSPTVGNPPQGKQCRSSNLRRRAERAKRQNVLTNMSSSYWRLCLVMAVSICNWVTQDLSRTKSLSSTQEPVNNNTL